MRVRVHVHVRWMLQNSPRGHWLDLPEGPSRRTNWFPGGLVQPESGGCVAMETVVGHPPGDPSTSKVTGEPSMTGDSKDGGRGARLKPPNQFQLQTWCGGGPGPPGRSEQKPSSTSTWTTIWLGRESPRSSPPPPPGRHQMHPG